MRTPVYLDYNATTPVDERVLERMLPFFCEHFGNASSEAHAYGWAADEAVEHAREQVAALLGAAPEEIIFTSGATEGINAALKGVLAAYARKGRHLVTVQTEHKAVLDACRALERQGAEVTYLPVGADGRVRVADVEAALRDDTVLVAAMWANNETGVLHPIPEIAETARSRGVLFMTDATQAAARVPLDVRHADLLVCSAHKMYGPKGTGALYVRRRNPRVRLVPLIDGGGQERSLRGGTLNTPGIVGLGAAAELVRQEREATAQRLSALRDTLEEALTQRVPGLRINGAGAPRLPQTSNVTIPGVEANKLMTHLRTLALSAGSACSSGKGAPSHVLTAMGLSPDEARRSLRLSLGRFTTAEEVTYAAEQLAEAVARLEAEAPASA